MIQITFNPKEIALLNKIINQKLTNAEFIASPIAMNEIAKAVFTITTSRFLKDLSLVAKQDSNKYHHLYEWGSVGVPEKKLFLMKRINIQYGNLSIAIEPLKSTKPVPIPSILLEPGLTDKVVSARHIFKNKMEVMENNKSVFIYTKRTIVFSPDNQSMIFVPKNNVIKITNPGGSSTKNALLKFSQEWYKIKPAIVIEQSQLMKQIANKVVLLINTNNSVSKTQVYNTIKGVTSSYSQEVSVM